MNEAYVEWLVRRKTPPYMVVLKCLMVALCAASVVLALTLPFGFVLVLAMAALTYLVFLHSSVEYEYLAIGGEITIDRILSKSKRKKAWEGSMEHIQLIAPSDSYLLKDYEKANMKTADYSSGSAGARTYAIISQKGSETTKVIFEPNAKMLHCLKQSAPRKVIES